MNLKAMNISSIKENSADSPKTPGGISKSLLTPCRRVGLSRKWRKGSVSPFISPLGNANANKEVKQEIGTRKRKKCDAEEEEKYREDLCENSTAVEIGRTPTRTILLKKKSKTLISAQKCDEIKNEPQSISELSDVTVLSSDKQQKCELLNNSKEASELNDEDMEQGSLINTTKVSTLSRKNSKHSIKHEPSESSTKNAIKPSENKPETIIANNNENLETEKDIQLNKHTAKESIKVKSPNNLTKECMVVIQKKIFKTEKKINSKTIHNEAKNNLPSQTLFDSDSDDVPLSDLNKLQSKTNNENVSEKIIEIKNPVVDIQNPKEKNYRIKQATKDNSIKQNSQTIDFSNKDSDDSDFVKTKKINIKNLEKTTSTTDLKNKAKPKTSKQQPKCIIKPSQTLNNMSDVDDDFDYNRTRTILIKKSYDKIPKLPKAKSTGSITQKDLDDLTARIERKKGLLLAKSMTNDTKELRELIKKWQIGCQTALMELMDLMKMKMPEHNMEHSELLQMLKIPPDLVGYDSESDSFNTPDDAAIILSALKIH